MAVAKSGKGLSFQDLWKDATNQPQICQWLGDRIKTAKGQSVTVEPTKVKLNKQKVIVDCGADGAFCFDLSGSFKPTFEGEGDERKQTASAIDALKAKIDEAKVDSVAFKLGQSIYYWEHTPEVTGAIIEKIKEKKADTTASSTNMRLTHNNGKISVAVIGEATYVLPLSKKEFTNRNDFSETIKAVDATKVEIVNQVATNTPFDASAFASAVSTGIDEAFSRNMSRLAPAPAPAPAPTIEQITNAIKENKEYKVKGKEKEITDKVAQILRDDGVIFDGLNFVGFDAKGHPKYKTTLTVDKTVSRKDDNEDIRFKTKQTYTVNLERTYDTKKDFEDAVNGLTAKDCSADKSISQKVRNCKAFVKEARSNKESYKIANSKINWKIGRMVLEFLGVTAAFFGLHGAVGNQADQAKEAGRLLAQDYARVVAQANPQDYLDSFIQGLSNAETKPFHPSKPNVGYFHEWAGEYGTAQAEGVGEMFAKVFAHTANRDDVVDASTVEGKGIAYTSALQDNTKEYKLSQDSIDALQNALTQGAHASDKTAETIINTVVKEFGEKEQKFTFDELFDAEIQNAILAKVNGKFGLAVEGKTLSRKGDTFTVVDNGVETEFKITIPGISKEVTANTRPEALDTISQRIEENTKITYSRNEQTSYNFNEWYNVNTTEVKKAILSAVNAEAKKQNLGFEADKNARITFSGNEVTVRFSNNTKDATATMSFTVEGEYSNIDDLLTQISNAEIQTAVNVKAPTTYSFNELYNSNTKVVKEAILSAVNAEACASTVED